LVEQTIIVCKQCGEAKPATDENYRRYYAGRKGRYKVCKTCESINARYRYLLTKSTPTEAEATEKDKITALYNLLKLRGLRVPRFGEGRTTDSTETVDKLLGKNEAIVDSMARVKDLPVTKEEPTEVPEELQSWLTCDLSGKDPEQLLNEVYDDLRDKYVAEYKTILEKVLTRFYDYEDEQLNGSE